MHVLRALQLAYGTPEFRDSIVCVFDCFSGCRTVVERLKDTRLFSDCRCFKSEDLNKGKGSTLKVCYCRSDFNAYIKSLGKVSSLCMFNTKTYDSLAAYHVLRKKGPVAVYYIEDAPMLYPYVFPSRRSVFLARLFGIVHPIYRCTRWYCSAPDLIDRTFKGVAVQLPFIDKNDLSFKTIVNTVFSYSEDPLIAASDYIIMEESFFTDGLIKDDCDLHFYQLLKKRFPKKRFAVKLHPRTTYNRYASDFDVIEKSDIPWEVIALNVDMSHKTLLCLSCSTSVSSKLLFNEDLSCIMLFNLFKDRILYKDGSVFYNDEWLQNLEKTKRVYAHDAHCPILIPHSAEELYAMLDQ